MKARIKATGEAEIEKLKEEYALCPTRNNYEDGLKEGRLIGYKDVLNKINTLEVKEMNEEPYAMSDIGSYTTTTK